VPAFKNILLPVDFTSNTDLSLKKAIDLADQEECAIHLVHVLKSKPNPNNGYPMKLVKLRELKEWLEISMPRVLVEIHVIRSNTVENGIVKAAIGLKTELIVIATRSGRKLFSFWKKILPARLAKKTGCAILSLKPGAEHTKIKSIVVPFRSHIPNRKLNALTHLAWKKNTTIYLVAMQNELKEFEFGDSSVTHTLIETYRLLKEDMNCQIVHKLITGNNTAKAILRFAESVNADVLVTNPDEMKISSFAGLDISDMLERDSKMQLLTIEPDAYHPN